LRIILSVLLLICAAAGVTLLLVDQASFAGFIAEVNDVTGFTLASELTAWRMLAVAMIAVPLLVLFLFSRSALRREKTLARSNDSYRLLIRAVAGEVSALSTGGFDPVPNGLALTGTINEIEGKLSVFERQVLAAEVDLPAVMPRLLERLRGLRQKQDDLKGRLRAIGTEELRVLTKGADEARESIDQILEENGDGDVEGQAEALEEQLSEQEKRFREVAPFHDRLVAVKARFDKLDAALKPYEDGTTGTVALYADLDEEVGKLQGALNEILGDPENDAEEDLLEGKLSQLEESVGGVEDRMKGLTALQAQLVELRSRVANLPHSVAPAPVSNGAPARS
jgi:hypothetical protein